MHKQIWCVLATVSIVTWNKSFFATAVDCSSFSSISEMRQNFHTDAQSRITNGTTPEINELPYQMLILVSDENMCGGTLISDIFVLTAAHCTAGFPEDKIKVYGGVPLVDNALQVRDVVQNIVHPKFKVSSIAVENDIALLQVKPFTISPNVKEIPLATAKTPLISPGLISGWGCTIHQKGLCRDAISQYRKQQFNKAEVPFVNDDDCRKSYASLNLKIFDEQICIGGSDQGTCNGDQGGPLVVTENGKRVLVGVASFVSDLGCGCDGIPSVYTEVHYFVDWIQDIMKNPKDGAGNAGIFCATSSVIWLCCLIKYLIRFAQN